MDEVIVERLSPGSRKPPEEQDGNKKGDAAMDKCINKWVGLDICVHNKNTGAGRLVKFEAYCLWLTTGRCSCPRRSMFGQTLKRAGSAAISHIPGYFWPRGP